MFPHTITIFNIYKQDNKVIYHKTEINKTFFYKTDQIIIDGRGSSNTNKYHCIIPLTSLNNYVGKSTFYGLHDKKNKFTLSNKDIVVLGTCGEISSINDLQTSEYEYFVISTINDNRYGSEDLQNIEVTS